MAARMWLYNLPPPAAAKPGTTVCRALAAPSPPRAAPAYRARKLLHALDAWAVVGLAVGGHEGGVGHLPVLLRPRHCARPHLRVALGAGGHAGVHRHAASGMKSRQMG